MTQEAKKRQRGVLSSVRNLLDHHRVGELLVWNGHITPGQLRYALVRQRMEHTPLGRVLLQESFVTRRELQKILLQQWTLRLLAGVTAIVIAFASFGIKPARAGDIKDVPAQLRLASTANAVFAPINSYPALFGAEERRSENLDPFTKWTSMFRRFDTALQSQANSKAVAAWQDDLRRFEGLSLRQTVERVNAYVNKVEYIEDKNNFGQSDYWATPVEFFANGGDCEDFAIAKYASLRALGVPEERMRLAIVHDTVKDIPHAVLIVYTDEGPVALDNQIKGVKSAETMYRYRPIFSINRHAWWLHSGEGTSTRLASAE